VGTGRMPRPLRPSRSSGCVCRLAWPSVEKEAKPEKRFDDELGSTPWKLFETGFKTKN